MKDIITKLAAIKPDQVNTQKFGDENQLTTSVQEILTGIIAALAIVAVIVIIIGGIGYMTSAGDTGKVKKAKDTILYGIIGLVVCALAFAIVNFVIGKL